jgi:hypothetical protein
MRTPARRMRTHAQRMHARHAPSADDHPLHSEILQELEGWREAVVPEEQVHTSRMRPHRSRMRRDGRGEAAVTEEQVAVVGRGGGADEKSASGLLDAEVLVCVCVCVCVWYRSWREGGGVTPLSQLGCLCLPWGRAVSVED